MKILLIIVIATGLLTGCNCGKNKDVEKNEVTNFLGE